MEQRVLFVNPDEGEKNKFMNSVRDMGYTVDYAPNFAVAINSLNNVHYEILVTTHIIDGGESHLLIQTAKRRNPDIIVALVAVSLTKSDIKFFYNICKINCVLLYPVDYERDFMPLLSSYITDRILEKIDIEDSVKKIEEKKRRKDMLQNVTKVLDAQEEKWSDSRRIILRLLEVSLLNQFDEMTEDAISTFKYERKIVDYTRGLLSQSDISLSHQMDEITKRFDEGTTETLVKFRLGAGMDPSYDGDFVTFGFVVWMLCQNIRESFGNTPFQCDISLGGVSRAEVFFKAYIDPQTFEKKKMDDKIRQINDVTICILEELTEKYEYKYSHEMSYHFIVDIGY